MDAKRPSLKRILSFSAPIEEINKENRLGIRTLAMAGIPLGLVNLLSQSVIVGCTMPTLELLSLTLYFSLLLLIDRRVLPERVAHATALLYLFQAPAMILAILLGTVWDPLHQASTILLLLMAMPVFVLDSPLRILLLQALWSSLFLLFSSRFKANDLFLADAVHVIEFYLASLIVTNAVLRVRLKLLRNLDETEYLLRHDQETNCQSRYALELNTGLYLGRPLVLLLADIDQLMRYKDFYGHDAADSLMNCFIRTMMERFGPDATYRYGGDEVLCVIPDSSPEHCLEIVEQCRDRMCRFNHQGTLIRASFSVGYVTGCPATVREFREMIQLADIHAHMAGQQGGGGTEGGAYDQESLHDGIVASHVSSQANSSEFSQLTGLPTLAFFISRIDELLPILNMEREPVLGFIRLTQLQEYNNRLGYSQGDRLIARTGELLRSSFDQRHVCYISGGHFAVLCFKAEAQPAMEALAAGLREFAPDFPLLVQAGFAQYTGRESIVSLLDKAKVAEASIHQQMGQLLRFYDKRLDEQTRFTRYIVEHVDEAIEKGWLKVYYQPIVRAVTGEVCNEEALSRWDDPTYGFLTPDRFIPLLEQRGLMHKLNLNVVRQVLRDFDRKREAGMTPVPVSVNLSRRDFESCDMVQEIIRLVDASGCRREMLKIEITESAFSADQALLKDAVVRFRREGFQVWLDDFGSEYSTLNLLQELDFDLIKLDMKFMRNYSTDSKNHIIISDIIDMSKRMGITTLIEGVETSEQYRILESLGCEKLQGYLFNRPNPLDYILERQRSGTGLVFEKPDAAPYYEAVGRVDLNVPMAVGAAEGDLQTDSEMPTGILELREGQFRCLRGGKRFFFMLRNWGVLAEETEAERFRRLCDPAPEELLSAAEYCLGSDAWTSFSVRKGERCAMTLYLRRISDREYGGAHAFLAVLLPDMVR